MNDDLPVQNEPSGLGTPADFSTFMRKYQDMVFTTSARLLRDDAQAQDIAQEVFIKAHEHFEMLSTSASAGGWLKTVATNLSINHLQRYRKRWRYFSEMGGGSDASGEQAPEVEFAAPDTFFEDVNAEERRAFVDDALGKLPDHQRIPLVLYHFEDIPYDEIARRLGISLAKVKTDILRARAALAKILSRGGASLEALSN
jgi:RNA polymerase sigma-70 factor (ECF subfamily)